MALFPRRLIALAAGVLACGAVAAAATASSGQAKPPVKLFLNYPAGAVAQPFGELSLPAAQAAVSAINKKGGLNGQQIQVGFCNNQTTAAASAACGREAVAFGAHVQYFTGPDNSGLPITGAARIPTLAEPTSITALKDKFLWALGTPSGLAQPAITWYLGKVKGCKSAMYVSADIGAAYSILTLARVMARRVGIGTFRHFMVPLTQADFLPVAQQIKESGVQCVQMALGKGPAISLMKALSQLGLGNLPLGNGVSVGSDYLDYPNGGEGMILKGSIPGLHSYPSPDDPTYRTYFADTRAAGMSDTDAQQGQAFQAWRAVKALEALSKTIKGTINRASILAALAKARNLKVTGLGTWSPGVKGPAAFPKASSDSVWLYTIKNGKWVSLTPKQPSHVSKELGFTK